MALEQFVPSSTMIAESTYDADQGVMTVVMKSGRSYDTEVTPEQWAEFKQAPSAGRWYRQNILGRD